MKRFLVWALAFFVCTQASYAQYFPPSGSGGSATPGGSSGDIQYNNSGALGGVTSVPPANGGTGLAPDFTSQALNFVAASSQKVTLPNASGLNPTTAITIEAWIRLDDANKAIVAIQKGPANGSAQAYCLVAYGSGGGDGLRAEGDGNTSGSWLSATNQVIPLGVWTHVAASFDSASGNAKLFYNGVEVSSYGAQSNTTVGGLLADANSAYIGFDTPYESDGYSSGAVADLRIYNVARTAGQILGDYRAALTSPYAASLKAYYKTNEGSGTSVVDAISANNGTTSGGVTWVASGLRPAAGTPVIVNSTQDGFSLPPGGPLWNGSGTIGGGGTVTITTALATTTSVIQLTNTSATPHALSVTTKSAGSFVVTGTAADTFDWSIAKP
jgi:hypothetical protein